MHPQPTVSLLGRNPLFRNFLLTSGISLLGSNIFDLAMPLYVLDRTHSVTALALVAFCLHLPHFLMAPLTGYIADHFDKRRVMLISDIGQVVCLSFLLIYETASAQSIVPILFTVFIAKSLMNLFETVTTFQLIPAIVPDDDLSSANTWFLSVHRVVQILGPLLGGLALGFFGVRSCILLNIVSFTATLYFTVRMRSISDLLRPPTLAVPHTLGRVYRNFVESIEYVWGSKLLRPFICLMFCWNLSSLLPNSPTFLYYFTQTKGFSASQYGLVAALFGVLGVVGFLRSTQLYSLNRFGRLFVGSCFWQAGLATIALCFFNYPVTLAIIFGVSRMGSSLVTMGTFLIRQTKIPIERSGAVNSCVRMFFMSSAPLSALIQALLIQHLGVYSALAFGAVLLWATMWFARAVANASADAPEHNSRKAA